jgi:hypothetical protein
MLETFTIYKKLTKAKVQAIFGKIVLMLSGWKSELMSQVGRAIYVEFVLTVEVLYVAMALDLLAWALKSIDMLRKGFLWRGEKSQGRTLPFVLAKSY